jgi:ATP-binding cassette subfamily B (MDR/TAP) protein 1
MGIGGVAVGFIIGWLYSIYMTLTLPIMFIGMGAFVYFIMKQASVTKDSYAKAGAIAEQAVSAVKTVMSLNGEDHEVKNYANILSVARKTTIKYGLITSFFFGIWFFALFAEYGFGYWIGAQVIKKNRWNHNASREYSV